MPGWTSRNLHNTKFSTLIAVTNNGDVYFVSVDGLFRFNIYNNYPPQFLLSGKYNGIAWDKYSLLYLIDNNWTITRFDINTKRTDFKDGSVIRSFMGTTPGSIAVDNNGDIYVCQQNYLFKLGMENSSLEIVAGTVGNRTCKEGIANEVSVSPIFVAVSPEDDSVYFADSRFKCIRKMEENRITTVAKDQSFLSVTGMLLIQKAI